MPFSAPHEVAGIPRTAVRNRAQFPRGAHGERDPGTGIRVGLRAFTEAGAGENADSGDMTDPTVAPYKQLRRPLDDRIVAGVCSGLGRYLSLDPVLIRV